MSTSESLPTAEQLAAARAFVAARRQQADAVGQWGTSRDVDAAFATWSRAVDEHLARTEQALDRGEAGEAARAWAVAVEGLAAWSSHPDFPVCLTDDRHDP
ncbi:hypothetical protein [Kitasatospora sp. DSM 101779]|uniref:hypothetical protein n=1 Tax=Kitasatospora sp. DSM 101779 TaxID=2853165 RepID=UPI0021D96B51|nr:hypothetical protein [Kitasatospora sp. DSM 101779]MCU7826684.1 hypothetical protein [Kitasatospora sp. DSM 101779]